MKRRNFITAGLAILAAPFSLSAKPKLSSDPRIEAMWRAKFALERMDPRKLAAMQKAAGPWRIVKQSEDGRVVLEREGYSPVPDGSSLDWVMGHVIVDSSGAAVSVSILTSGYKVSRNLTRGSAVGSTSGA